MESISSPRLRHIGALDGLRAIAVLLVLAYHGGVSWAGGGFLGVEVFFVLSGFLITTLLLAETRASGTVRLRAFWARRARRLLPALVCLVLACTIYESLAGPGHAVPDFGADALATLFYIANWHQLWTGDGYFAQTALVSPLQHTWSLAIEEQFYLVWPLVILAVVGRRGNRQHHEAATARLDRLRMLLAVTVVGAIASSAEMAWLYHGGSGLNRVYYGTDTRASPLLVGASLAIVRALAEARHPDRAGSSSPKKGTSRSLGRISIGILGAIGIVAALAFAGGTASWLYEGGFFGVDIAVIAVVASVTVPTALFSPLEALLSTSPLRAIGQISYGLYLWHFPLYLWLTAAATGISGTPLLWVRIAASFAAATLSYFVVEQPVRQRRLSVKVRRVLAPTAGAAVLACTGLAWSATAGAGASVVLAPSFALGARPIGPQRQGPGGKTCSAKLPGARAPQIFDRCPPVRVMLVGDSIGLTLGLEMALEEGRYGVALDDAAILGCSFTIKGESNSIAQSYGRPYGPCLTSLQHWHLLEQTTKPQAIVVEMGYWDEMNWLQDGRYVHLGEPSFDAQLHERVVDLVDTLGSPRVPVVFLSVPWMSPAPLPNGSPAPQGSTKRHDAINDILESVAREMPGRAYFFNLSPEVTPGNRYDFDVDGMQCRDSDGLHFYDGDPSQDYWVETRCGASASAALLPYLRRLVLSSEHHVAPGETRSR